MSITEYHHPDESKDRHFLRCDSQPKHWRVLHIHQDQQQNTIYQQQVKPASFHTLTTTFNNWPQNIRPILLKLHMKTPLGQEGLATSYRTKPIRKLRQPKREQEREKSLGTTRVLALTY